MKKDREQANVMRKSGMSYSDIRSKMAVSRSTLSAWFSVQEWNKDIAKEMMERSRQAGAMRLMVLNAIRGNRLKKIYEEAKQDAFLDFEELKYHPLFIAGLMAYWSHGDMTSGTKVSFTSSNEHLIKIFSHFIDRLCGVHNFKVRIQLRDQNMENEAKKHWSLITGVNADLFGKSTIIKGNKSPKTGSIRAKTGICNIVVSSAYLKSKFVKWLELLAGIV